MKTKILFLGILLLFMKGFDAQIIGNPRTLEKDSCNKNKEKPSPEDNTEFICYDFASGNFDKKKITVRRNEAVAIKIKNINPFFYRINVKSDDKIISYLNTDRDEVAKVTNEIEQMNYYKIQEQYSFELGAPSLFIEAPDNKEKIEELNKLNEDINSKNKLGLDEKFYKEKIDRFLKLGSDISNIQLDSLKIFQNNLLKIQKDLIGLDYEIQKKVNSTTNQDIFKTVLNDRITRLNSRYYFFEKNAREIIKLNQNYNNYVDKVITAELTYCMYQNILENQEKKIKDGEKIPQIETTFLLDIKKLNGAYSTFNNYKTAYQEMVNELNEFTIFLNYSNLNVLNDKEFVRSVLLKDIDRLQKSVKNIDEVVQKINLSKKLNQVEVLDRLLRKKTTYEYVSAPIQGEEDYLEFDVAIKSKRDMKDTFHVDNDKSFKYRQYINGGIRFDFSLGTVFDFGTTDEKYTLDQNNSIKKMNNNRYNPTIAAMFHASFRNSSDFAFGFTVGTSFNTNFSFNSLFPGVSILFGKRNKFILTAGPSFRLVDELKSNYQEGEILNNGITDEDLLVKNFKVGVFFGLSYNLTPKQQSSLKFGE